MKLLKPSLEIPIGIFLIFLAAQFAFSVPGSPVPITLQTLAIISIAIYLGTLKGGGTVLLYLLIGIVGLPVFSKGRAGWEVFCGPSLGFFLGFLVAAVLVGLLSSRKKPLGFPGLLGLFVLGHVIILVSGYIGLVWMKGPTGLWENVFLPLLPGGVIKSLLGAGGMYAIYRLNW